MKKIVLTSIAFLFLLFILGVGCIIGYIYFKAPRYQPFVPSGTLSLDEVAKKGLYFQDMSIEKGLTGWYERGDYIIYFGSKRGGINPWEERILFEAPEFETSTIFSDNKGQRFINQGGSFAELPNNKKISNINQGEVNFLLALDMMNLLKQAKINPALDYEYDAIISGEESLKDGLIDETIEVKTPIELLNYCDRYLFAEKLEIDGTEIINRIMQLYTASDKNNCVNFEQIDNIAVLKKIEEGPNVTRIFLYDKKVFTKEQGNLSTDEKFKLITSNDIFPQVLEFNIDGDSIYEVTKFDGSSKLLGKIK